MSLLCFGFLTGFLFWGFVGFLVGKYHERTEWNKLIEKNIIPAPNKKQ